MSKDRYPPLSLWRILFLLNIFFAITRLHILCIIKYFCSIRRCVCIAHEPLQHHIEVNFITTVKDAVAKRFEQLYDQREICLNELTSRAGAYSKIDLLFQSKNIFILQTAPLANIKDECYTEAIKKHWRCPLCPVLKEARTRPRP